MRSILFLVLGSFTFLAADAAIAAPATKGKPAQLTPQQKAHCARVKDNQLRNTRMPGTAKGPRYCRNA